MASNQDSDPDDPLPQDDQQAQDVVVIDGAGDGAEKEKEGSTKDKEITIGQPDIEDYNCHASVAFSHNYFKKNNNETATCLTCEKMNKSTKDKTMMRNAVLTTCQGSTSGILSFINYYWSSLIF